MKTVKRLFALAVLLAVGYAALWVVESPYYALYNIKQGLDEKDAVKVERYVDLEAMVKASADLFAALAKERIGVAGSDPGSSILGAIVGAVASGVGAAASVQGAMEIRRAIQDGRMRPQLGPFIANDGVDAIGPIQRFDKSAIVDVKGTCAASPAVVRLVFEQKDVPGLFGRPRKSVLRGIDRGSLPALARACAAKGAGAATR